MPLRLEGPPERTLLGVIRQVRRRWRFKLLLRGGALAGGAALVVFVLSSWLLDRTGFSPGVLLASRVLGYGLVLWLAFRYLLRPLARRVSDERVALYLEEHEPELHELVLSGLELERRGEHSPLGRRTVERALERCHRLADGRALDQREINRFGTAFATVTVIALLLALLQPALLRQGAGALLNPLKGAAASDPYSIEVEPGNVTIARGADQAIRAHLRGFAATDAELVVRTGSDSSFQRVPMFSAALATSGGAASGRLRQGAEPQPRRAADSGSYEVLLFDVAQPTEYFVEAGGIRSAVYRIDVADLPYVKTLALEYRYPEYTGLPPERIEEGGDVAVLRGTMVHVFATTTLPAKGGTLVLSSGQRLPLRPLPDSTLTAAFKVEQQGFYHLEFVAANGQVVTGSPEYTIDILPDRAPSVRFSKPGRDTRPTITDEVFLEAQAEDDYGVGAVDLFYSVNGGEEKRIELFRSEHGPTEITAGHTLYLEELGLEPGDIVSYYARAKDASGSGREVTSDIYFLTMRPFGREYRQAESGQLPPGAGQQPQEQGAFPGELTRQQREIVAATFNLVRDSAQYTADAFKEYANTISLMQDRLRQQVMTLAQRMQNRQVTTDTMFAQIAEILPRAAAVMDTVLAQLRGRGPRAAISPEQRALQQLERAEALYREVQVQLQQQQGGGGGGGSPNASDLADLFELELDKLRNQYETVQRGEREQTEQQVDAELEKLRELARRLQQENERQRRLAMQGGQQQAGGGGAAQRQLAEELEQAARQLQRLSREQPQQQELERAARELEQAADALRRNAAEARNASSAGTQQALDRVNQATRRLQGERGSGMEQQTREALQRAERLADQQRETGDRMERASEPGSPTAGARDELIQRRTEQLSQTQLLEQELDRLAAGTRRDQRDASRRLQQAADAIRDSNLKEMQSFSRNLMRDRASPDMVRQFENRMDTAMDSVVDQVRGAVGAFTQSDDQRVAQGLERAADLARGLESMRERTQQQQEQQARAREQQGQRGQQQGQAGQQPGQQGQQPGQAGQQPGQQGQAGQQQGQRGQQQGQSGQQQGQAGQQQGQRGQQQGQSGQQGQQAGGQTGGQRGQNRAGGQAGGDPRGSPFGGGGAGGRVRPGVTPDQARQLRAEARERLTEADALRRELVQQGQDVAQLEAVMRSLRGLDREGIYADASQLQLLQTQAAENMKAYEFALRRALLGESRDKLYLSGSDEVPEGYRKLVEEYYRGLARKR